MRVPLLWRQLPGALTAQYVAATVSAATAAAAAARSARGAAAPYLHRFTALTTGTPYSVRVRGVSGGGLGSGAPTHATPSAVAPPFQKLAPPTALALFLGASTTNLRAAWGAPPSNGGAAVTKNLLEWDAAATF